MFDSSHKTSATVIGLAIALLVPSWTERSHTQLNLISTFKVTEAF